MRTLSLVVLGIIISMPMLFAQEDSIMEITFAYDAAGNRIEREIVYYQPSFKSTKVVTEEEEPEFDQGLNVYPNPAQHSLFVNLNEEALETKGRQILMYNSVGKLVLQVPAYEEVTRVDVSRLTNGTYILKLEYGTKHKEWIIIKN